MTSRTILILMAFLLVSLTAYFGFVNWDSGQSAENWRKQGTTLTELNSRLKALSEQIQTAHGESICEVSGQCKLIGMGTRTCGDFKDYLIYSTKDADETRLRSLVTAFNETHEKISSLSLAVGTCGIKPAHVGCVNGRCVPH